MFKKIRHETLANLRTELCSKEAIKNYYKVQQDFFAEYVMPGVKEFLEQGKLPEANKAFYGGWHMCIERSPAITIMEQQIEDANESELLGESIYPPECPMEDRWVRPDFIAKEFGSDCVWHPGRVLRTEENVTHVVFASEFLTGDMHHFDTRIQVGSFSKKDLEKTGYSLSANPFIIIVEVEKEIQIRTMPRGFNYGGVKLAVSDDATYDEVWKYPLIDSESV